MAMTEEQKNALKEMQKAVQEKYIAADKSNKASYATNDGNTFNVLFEDDKVYFAKSVTKGTPKWTEITNLVLDKGTGFYKVNKAKAGPIHKDNKDLISRINDVLAAHQEDEKEEPVTTLEKIIANHPEGLSQAALDMLGDDFDSLSMEEQAYRVNLFNGIVADVNETRDFFMDYFMPDFVLKEIGENLKNAFETLTDEEKTKNEYAQDTITAFLADNEDEEYNALTEAEQKQVLGSVYKDLVDSIDRSRINLQRKAVHAKLDEMTDEEKEAYFADLRAVATSKRNEAQLKVLKDYNLAKKLDKNALELMYNSTNFESATETDKLLIETNIRAIGLERENILLRDKNSKNRVKGFIYKAVGVALGVGIIISSHFAASRGAKLDRLENNVADAIVEQYQPVSEVKIVDKDHNEITDFATLNTKDTYYMEIVGKKDGEDVVYYVQVSNSLVNDIKNGNTDRNLNVKDFASTKEGIDYLKHKMPLEIEKIITEIKTEIKTEYINVDNLGPKLDEMFTDLALPTNTEFTFVDKDGNVVERNNLAEDGEYYIKIANDKHDFKAKLSKAGISAAKTGTGNISKEMFDGNDNASNFIVGRATVLSEEYIKTLNDFNNLNGSIIDTEVSLEDGKKIIIKTIGENLKQLVDAYNAKAEKCTELDNLYSEAKGKADELTNKLNELQENYDGLVASGALTAEELNKAKEDIKDLEQEKTNLNNEIENLKSNLDAAATEKDELNQTINSLRQQIYELQNKENESGSYAPGDNGDNTGSTVTEGDNKAPSNGDSNADVSDRPGSGTIVKTETDSTEKENEDNEDVIKVDEKGNVVIESGWTFGG